MFCAQIEHKIDGTGCNGRTDTLKSKSSKKQKKEKNVMRERVTKRILALTLVLVMVVTAVPTQALAAKKPSLNKKTMTVIAGESATLKVQNAKSVDMKWSTSNKKYVTVSKTGVVKALKAGKSATITCKVKVNKNKKYTLTCKVKTTGTKTVTTQKQLNSALKNKKLTKIILKTKAEKVFKVASGSYKATFIVDAPNADVENSGVFKAIEIKNIKPSTFFEKATGNHIKVEAKEARLVVDKAASVAQITMNGKDATIAVENNGSIESLALNEAVNVTLSGEGNAVPVVVSPEAEGASLTASIPVAMEVASSINLKLEKGAENSSVKVTEAAGEIKLNLTNETTEAITLTDSNGKENSIAQGSSTTVVDKPGTGSSTEGGNNDSSDYNNNQGGGGAAGGDGTIGGGGASSGSTGTDKIVAEEIKSIFEIVEEGVSKEGTFLLKTSETINRDITISKNTKLYIAPDVSLSIAENIKIENEGLISNQCNEVVKRAKGKTSTRSMERSESNSGKVNIGENAIIENASDDSVINFASIEQIESKAETGLKLGAKGKVIIGGETYIGPSDEAMVTLSIPENSSAGWYLNGDGWACLVCEGNTSVIVNSLKKYIGSLDLHFIMGDGTTITLPSWEYLKRGERNNHKDSGTVATYNDAKVIVGSQTICGAPNQGAIFSGAAEKGISFIPLRGDTKKRIAVDIHRGVDEENKVYVSSYDETYYICQIEGCNFADGVKESYEGNELEDGSDYYNENQLMSYGLNDVFICTNGEFMADLTPFAWEYYKAIEKKVTYIIELHNGDELVGVMQTQDVSEGRLQGQFKKNNSDVQLNKELRYDIVTYASAEGMEDAPKNDWLMVLCQDLVQIKMRHFS